MHRASRAIAVYPLLFILLTASGGCSDLIVSAGNYLTYDHAFNDKAAAKAQADAEKLCAQRKQKAVQTRSVCTMTRCTTDFQCVDRKDPGEYEPGPFLPHQY